MLDESSVREATGPWLDFGFCTACGPRERNEDTHLLVRDWNSHLEAPSSLFAVCDGHGGPQVSQYAVEWLSDHLCHEFAMNDIKTREGRQDAVERAFLALDSRLQHDQSIDARDCGSTCVAAIAWRVDIPLESDGFHQKSGCKVLLANLGDSRGLVCRPGVGLIAETIDHKPDFASEKARIVKAGGCVKRGLRDVPRLDGDLAMSRAFGDFRFKDDDTRSLEFQRLCPIPEIYEVDAQSGDVIVLACDGVFDVLRSSKVSSLVLQYLSSHPSGDMTSAAEIVVEAALRKTRDNATCVVVYLGDSENDCLWGADLVNVASHE